MNTPVASYSVKICRGAASCPHAVLTADLSGAFEEIITASGWPEFLAARVHPVRHHHQFRLAVSSCPNGCSQPHITDFALVATAGMEVHRHRCTQCGQCVAACAEDALHLEGRSIRLNESRCLGCEACARVCPTQALRVSSRKYRVLTGGKLGRHPRLAHEVGTASLEEAQEILRRTLDVFMQHYTPRTRLGDIVERLGQERFDALIRP